MSIGDLLAGGMSQLTQGTPVAGPGGSGGSMVAQNQNGQASQAAQSPGDLVQAYMKLYQQDRSADQIDRGLAGIATAFAAPGTQNAVYNSLAPQGRDPGAMLGNIVKLHQMQQEQNAYNQARSPEVIGDISKRTGLSPAMTLAGVNAGKEGDLITNAAGISGPPGTQEMTKDRQVFMAKNGITDLSDPRIPDYLVSPSKYATHVDVQNEKAKDVNATQGNFATATQAYDTQLENVNKLLDPANKQYINEFLGPYQGKYKPIGELSDPAQKLKLVYDNVMAGQFAQGVSDFPGSRISTKELVADAPSKSTMQLGQAYDDFVKSGQQYATGIAQHRADLFGKAHQLNSPSLSDYDYNKVNDIFKTGGDQGPEDKVYRPAPAAVGSVGDIHNLPKGRGYVVPKGLPQAGETVYRGYE